MFTDNADTAGERRRAWNSSSHGDYTHNGSSGEPLFVYQKGGLRDVGPMEAQTLLTRKAPGIWGDRCRRLLSPNFPRPPMAVQEASPLPSCPHRPTTEPGVFPPWPDRADPAPVRRHISGSELYVSHGSHRPDAQYPHPDRDWVTRRVCGSRPHHGDRTFMGRSVALSRCSGLPKCPWLFLS